MSWLPTTIAPTPIIANLLVTVRNPDGTPMPEDLKQAKTHLDILREKQPNTPETHEAWANYYAAQNNIAAAMQEMQQAIELDPNRSESYLLLAPVSTALQPARPSRSAISRKQPKSIPRP